jgi:hypothetical protein
MMKRRELLAAAAGALTAAALVSGVVWAAIPEDRRVIQGCHNSGAT